jgi:hypothetical protein
MTLYNMKGNSPKTALIPTLDKYFAYFGIISSCMLNDLKIEVPLQIVKNTETYY